MVTHIIEIDYFFVASENFQGKSDSVTVYSYILNVLQKKLIKIIAANSEKIDFF